MTGCLESRKGLKIGPSPVQTGPGFRFLGCFSYLAGIDIGYFLKDLHTSLVLVSGPKADFSRVYGRYNKPGVTSGPIPDLALA